MTVCYGVMFCIHFRDEQNLELKIFLIQGNIVAVVMIDTHLVHMLLLSANEF